MPPTIQPGENPLSKDDFNKVMEAQRILHDILPTIDSHERCGNDCEAFRTVHKFLGEKLAALQREFFTPPPSLTQ